MTGIPGVALSGAKPRLLTIALLVVLGSCWGLYYPIFKFAVRSGLPYSGIMMAITGGVAHRAPCRRLRPGAAAGVPAPHRPLLSRLRDAGLSRALCLRPLRHQPRRCRGADPDRRHLAHHHPLPRRPHPDRAHDGTPAAQHRAGRGLGRDPRHPRGELRRRHRARGHAGRVRRAPQLQQLSCLRVAALAGGIRFLPGRLGRSGAGAR